MLRVSQQLSLQLNKYAALVGSQARCFSDVPAAQTSADIETVKPFDPNGSLAQIDNYMEGLDDGYVKSFRALKNMTMELDKIASEKNRAGPSVPTGMVMTAAGSIDKEYYLKTMKVHPDLITLMEKVMQEEIAARPKAQPDNAWEEYVKSIQPVLDAEHKKIDEEMAAIAEEQAKLDAVEKRLDIITVNEMLEMYPVIAQEIKHEIESGDFEERPLGYVAIPAQ